MALHNKVGSWGENVATELLVSKGYAIVERNWKMNGYEIDIIAMHGSRIVFVEVKTRTSTQSDPLAAVDRRRMKRMAVAAHHYILMNNIPHEPQFDLIAVSGSVGNHQIEHVADAFLPPLRTY